MLELPNQSMSRSGLIEVAVNQILLQYIGSGRGVWLFKNMDFVPKHRFLELRPDSFKNIRKDFNLDKPGRMKEAVQLLHEWVQKQSHFRKKDFDPFYLETTILGSKGSLERAKMQLDKICTMRTLMPTFFGNFNMKTDFEYMNEVVQTVVLPKLTADHYRVALVKYNNLPFDVPHVMDYFRSNIIFAEYLKIHDYLHGFIVIADFTGTNLMNYVTKVSPMLLKQALEIYMEGYGLRLKGIHIISTSKLVDALVSILKQVLSQKISERIHVHQTIDDIQKYIPKEILPKDYGGDERSLKELSEEWIDILSSKENMDYLADMNNACTDESCRQRDVFSEQYAGMPGSFRLLSVD